MRTRLAISVAIGTLALAFAAQAIADPPAQVSPGDGAAFTSGDPIVFRATTATLPAAPPDIDVHISRDPGLGAEGVLANRFDSFRAFPVAGDPAPLYEGAPAPDDGWPKKPDTYFWQATDVGCLPAPCESGVLSFTINPLPASAVTSPTQIETFLDRHPRHRTHKRRVKFKFSSNVEGATFRCLFASGWAACDSPQVFRRLEPGRYKFKTRAVVNDLKDPTPVRWVYRILRGNGGG